MANIYTDASRQERYSKLRTRKHILETLRSVIMYPAVILAVGILIGGILASVLGGTFGNLSSWIGNLLNIAAAIATIIAIYQHKWRVTVGVLVGTLAVAVFSPTIGSIIDPILLIFTLILDIRWTKLEKEEGFPHFEIPLDEYDQRAKHAEQIIRTRAIAAGHRVEAAPEVAQGSADMHDIIEEGAVPAFSATLTGYHDRTRGHAAPGTQRTAQHGGEMDDLL